jgi:hypothetical protein
MPVDGVDEAVMHDDRVVGDTIPIGLTISWD